MTAPWKETTLPTILARYQLKDILMQMNLVCYTKRYHQNVCTSGKQCSGGKHSKVRWTWLDASKALGEKIPLFVTGKSASPRCFKHIHNLPCRYRSQKKAWMDGKFFKEWLHELDRKFGMQGRKVSMIVDNCPAHPEISGLKTIKLQFFPPNTTSCRQQREQGVKKCLCFITFLFY